MAKVLGVAAGLLWVAGLVLLVVGLLDARTAFDVVLADRGFADVFFRQDKGFMPLLTIGTVLVGVAGVLTAGLVLARTRR